MFEYTIAAIPTIYRGVKYRSRLEAKWAAFFDALKWRHEYEPYEMGLWSPDFLLWPSPESSICVLVEVKPISDVCQETINRMSSACEEKGAFLNDNPANIAGAVLVGVAPVLDVSRFSDDHPRCELNLGWLINGWNKHNPADIYKVIVGWAPDFDKPGMSADIMSIDSAAHGYWTIVDGGGMWMPFEEPPVKAYGPYTMALWKSACNSVQWEGRDA